MKKEDHTSFAAMVEDERRKASSGAGAGNASPTFVSILDKELMTSSASQSIVVPER